MGSNALNGISILLVEDEPAIARAVAVFLRSMGATIVGPASTVSEAIALEQASAFDVAVLDFKLKGETVTVFADQLLAARRRFLFYTSCRQVVLKYPQALVIEKPSRLSEIVGSIKYVLQNPPAA